MFLRDLKKLLTEKYTLLPKGPVHWRDMSEARYLNSKGVDGPRRGWSFSLNSKYAASIQLSISKLASIAVISTYTVVHQQTASCIGSWQNQRINFVNTT